MASGGNLNEQPNKGSGMLSFALRSLGRYELLEQIGSGGNAVVFKALDTSTNRIVAVKVLDLAMGLQSDQCRRLKREANIVVQLRHPNIVPIEYLGEEDGLIFLVMPYFSGGTLADRIEHGSLTPNNVGCTIDQIVSALSYAHGRGVVHRDIKPANILFDENGDASLSDFGLASINDSSLSLTGAALIGTPAYISPEQALGREVSSRSDQYSLGVVLYQLGTGKLPFEAETPIAVLLKHIKEPLPFPRKVKPDFPESIERVILKSMAKSPKDRFDSMAQMNEAFQAALAHTLDPNANPAPEITLPSAIESTQAIRAPRNLPGSTRGKRRRKFALVLTMLLALLAVLSAFAFRGVLNGSVRQTDSDPPMAKDTSAGQLTALAGTIEAMSTEMAKGQASDLPADFVHTAVIQTLSAMKMLGESENRPTLTLTPSPMATNTPTRTATTEVILSPTWTFTSTPSQISTTIGFSTPTANGGSEETPAPTEEPAPTEVPEATEVPKPTKLPKPTKVPKATRPPNTPGPP